MMDGKSYTKIARIPQRSTNLHRVDQLNQLSRDAANLDEHEFEKKLNEIIHETPYTNLTDLLFAGLSALGFVLVFGGSFTDALIAFLIGMLVRLLDKTLGKLQINSFFSVAISSATLTILTLLASHFHLTVSADTVIIGTITNAVRDSIAGDLISGLARGAEALLIAVAVALGNGLGMMIWIWMGGIIG